MALPKTVIIVTGPTAVGKTSVAIELAKYFETEIISADSRQCFRELSIGVARPSPAELKTIPHHFIASHSISENINAATFEKYALQKTNELFALHDVVVMTGGTGLYVKIFCEGMDAIPETPGHVRDKIISDYEKYGLEWLQQQVELKDPEFYRVGEIRNPQRLMRALEVSETTGRSILAFRKGEKKKREFNIIKIGLELPKNELHHSINARVDSMIAAGLVDEVKKLLPFKNLNALQTVGYSEVIDYLEGRRSLADAIELIKTNTRQYAKRQITWFKRDKDIMWFAPSEIDQIKKASFDALHDAK